MLTRDNLSCEPLAVRQGSEKTVVLLTERYAKQIRGVLSCHDRVVVMGTLPCVCYAEGMAAHLRAKSICLFDCPRFSRNPSATRSGRLRNAWRRSTGWRSSISSHAFRKEDRIRALLAVRGEHPDLVHIFIVRY